MDQASERVKLAERINHALKERSDKDWNYSRISLINKSLHDITSPYVLSCEWIELDQAQGENDLKTLAGEIKWGDRHSSELGILELISLRLNKALLETTSDEFWDNRRPVIRVQDRDLLIQQGITDAFWYAVEEVRGEDFDNR